MNKSEIIRIVNITAALTTYYYSTQHLLGTDIFSIEGVKLIPKALSLLGIFRAFYFWIGWKIKYFNKILYRPNLSGTWIGEYKSKNNTTGEEFAGTISVVINQSFTEIGIKNCTDKHNAYSYAEKLSHCTKNDLYEVIYLYSQDNANPPLQEARKGVSELKLIQGLKRNSLYGPFWTNVNSIGSLNVEFLTPKRLSSFSEAQNHFKDK